MGAREFGPRRSANSVCAARTVIGCLFGLRSLAIVPLAAGLMKIVAAGRGVAQTPNLHTEIITPSPRSIFPSQVSVTVLSFSVSRGHADMAELTPLHKNGCSRSHLNSGPSVSKSAIAGAESPNLITIPLNVHPAGPRFRAIISTRQYASPVLLGLEIPVAHALDRALQCFRG